MYIYLFIFPLKGQNIIWRGILQQQWWKLSSSLHRVLFKQASTWWVNDKIGSCLFVKGCHPASMYNNLHKISIKRSKRNRMMYTNPKVGVLFFFKFSLETVDLLLIYNKPFLYSLAMHILPLKYRSQDTMWSVWMFNFFLMSRKSQKRRSNTRDYS